MGEIVVMLSCFGYTILVLALYTDRDRWRRRCERAEAKLEKAKRKGNS